MGGAGTEVKHCTRIDYELENDLENFKNGEWPDEAEFGSAVKSSAEYLQERIESYNEFSLRMYQLTAHDTCEDNSCQGWRDRLKIFRNKLTTIKAEFNHLLHCEPLETDSIIVINPVESTTSSISHTFKTTPLAEIENKEIFSPPITHFPPTSQSNS